MKVAIYARVSKSEEGVQNPENQLKPLRELASAHGWIVVREYVDYASGGSANRPQFQQMMSDAWAHQFGMLLVWSLDRFSREGILSTLKYIEKLNYSNVFIKSLQDSWLDTQDKSMCSLLISIIAWVSETERKRISERTKAALRGNKRVGKRGKDKKPRRKGGYYLRYSKEKRFKKTEPKRGV